jgi:mRNA interferase HigB
MRIIAEKMIKDFWISHPDAQGALEAWVDHVKRATYMKPEDIQADYGPDVILPNNRAVFNIKGNNYRLVVHIHYKSQIMFVRFLGTHKNYDHIDALTI